MKKTKFLKSVLVFVGLFFVASFGIADAFNCKTECQLPLTTFSNGNFTFDVSFPAGGGTTCETIADCPTIKLPDNATIFSMKVEMELTDPASEIGTPFIWVPISVANGYITQIDTRDGFEVEIARYKVGNNPSRTFVMPGGDVWVANRDSGNITKLSPLTGDGSVDGFCGDNSCGTDETIYSCFADCNGNVCGDGTGTCKNNIVCGNGTEDCKEYKVVGSYVTGAGPRGVTGDISGFVWVANRDSNNVVKLNPTTGVILSTVNTGGGPYGLIADQFGYVWVSNRSAGTVQVIDTISENVVNVIPITGDPYGIGIDADGNILIASLGASTIKINGYGTDFPGTIAWTVPLVGGASTRGRGIASDLNGNIWVGSDNGGIGTVYSFKPDGTQYCPPYNPAPQHNTVGIAVDFNNNIWVVPYDGSVLKLKPNNINACTTVIPVATVFVSGGLLYNYSDMTGLRTVSKTLTVNGMNIPLSAEGVFVIKSGVCVPSDLSSCINPVGSLNCGSADGLCEVELKIFSMQIGDYTLKNLEVIYGKQVPITTGGMVPCGRENNDPATPWDDTKPCSLCFLIMLLNQIANFLLMIASTVALLAFVITGFLFITSSGNPERKTLAMTSFKLIIVGFLIIFLSWLFIDFILSAWGYLDPLGGKWDVVCD